MKRLILRWGSDVHRSYILNTSAKYGLTGWNQIWCPRSKCSGIGPACWWAVMAMDFDQVRFLATCWVPWDPDHTTALWDNQSIFHRFGGHSEPRCLQYWTNFHRSQAWQIGWILNTASHQYKVLGHGLFQELEDTIASLKSQVSSLQQRAQVLQDELDMRTRYPANQLGVSMATSLGSISSLKSNA